MMYEKNLTEDLRLRLTTEDMNFLRKLSNERGTSLSSCIRSIIGDYRRSLDFQNAFTKVMQNMAKGEGLSNGDTETNFNDIL